MKNGQTASAGVLVTGGGRTLDALKDEVMRRVERGAPPLAGIPVEDARAALAAITSLEREEWAGAFRSVAEAHYRRGEALVERDPDAGRREFWLAWRLYHYARWPTENTPLRLRAKQSALEAFRRHATLLDPVVETVRIPLDGGSVVAYLRAPKSSAPPPVVLAISGLDSRKEDIAAHTEPYMERGMAIAAVDMPGTGEAPCTPTEAHPERMFTALIDYLLTRTDVDATRIVVQGRSFSGYWAAKLAYAERERVRGVVMHGGPIHHTFQPDWCAAALSTGEYLYDYFEAWSAMMGTATLEALLPAVQRLSLLDIGLLDESGAPMLVVNGARDTQIMIEDAFLLLRHGDAKQAWINPRGGHMGRSPDWPPGAIAERVLLPWMAERLRAGD